MFHVCMFIRKPVWQLLGCATYICLTHIALGEGPMLSSYESDTAKKKEGEKRVCVCAKIYIYIYIHI